VSSEVVRTHYSVAANAFYWFIRGAVAFLAKVLFRLKIEGQEHLPAAGAYIVAPTHRSNLDGFMISTISKRRIRFMAKKSLWSNRPSGWFFTTMGGFPVDRDHADRHALRACGEVIGMGFPLIVFPEGQRREGPVVEDLYQGPSYLAHKYGIPILPIGIGGSATAMPVGAKYIRPRRIEFIIGDPIEVAPSERRAKRSEIEATTAQLEKQLQGLFDEAQRRVGTPNE
jgi:1-acyl-sn-glycerol-3-phosphate acyltransferase